MPENEPGFPPTAFPKAPVRADDLCCIVSHLRQRHCCALVGPSNMGKSVLLQSLLTEEVRQRCAPAGAQPPVIVFVDCLAAEPTEQAFHGLLLGGIIEELEGRNIAGGALKAIKALQDKVLQSTDLGARSLFASSLRELARASEVRLVLILDEFDDVFQTLSPWPFRQLRVLHDELQLRCRLHYVVATSRRLERLRSDPDTFEFRELFVPYTRVLRPLHGADAERFIAYLAEEDGHDLDQKQVPLAIQLSGSHPGLLERIYGLLRTHRPDPTASLQTVAVRLSERRRIRKECQRLWDELEEEERDGLLALVQGNEALLEAEQRRELEAKGLVAEREDGGLAVFSPVFEAFVGEELTRRGQAVPKGIRCDLGSGRIWVDGREVTWLLTELQRRFVLLLWQKRGTVCT